MQTRGLLIATVASVIHFGCAPMPPKSGDGDIHTRSSQDSCNMLKKCEATVTLLATCPGTFNKCLKVDPYFIIVTDDAKVDITWTLATLDQKDFSFDPKDGIKFVNDNPTDPVFKCATDSKGKWVTCKNGHPKEGIKVYKYSIHVVYAGWSPFPPIVDILDPYVVNN